MLKFLSKQKNFSYLKYTCNDKIYRNINKITNFNIAYTNNTKLLVNSQIKNFNTKVENSTTKSTKNDKASMKNIYRYLKPYFTQGNAKKMLIYSLGLTIISKGLVSMAPYFIKLTVNAVLERSDITIPLLFLLASTLCRVVGVGIQEWRQIILNKVSSGAIVNFSKDMMSFLMKLEFSTFKRDSETVMNSFTKSMQALDRFNRFVVGHVMSNATEIVIISIMLFTLLGPKYFLNTILTYALYMMVTRKISNMRGLILRDKHKAEVLSENKIHDIVFNIDTVKYFQREEKESENFANIIKGVREKDQKVVSSLSLLNSSQTLIISLGMMINLSMGIYDVFQGSMTTGDLVMLQAIFAQIMIPLNFMGSLMREIDETRVNLQYTLDMIEDKEKMTKTEKSGNKLFEFKSGKIEFENVNFKFPHSLNSTKTHDKLILNNTNVVFLPGTMNAIVGYSGQGKSTIFNLLYKLYEPNSGKILVDGQDLSEINVDSYRQYLSICPQNGHLFNESILYNIKYGNHNATDEDVFNVTKDVNIYKKIQSFDDKYETNVGSLGSKLSGGEKQRLLLSRSFIKDSKILLLDEPTSNLDNLNEKFVLDYIHKIKKDKTILITAHRLSTITQCDMIYVMNKGHFVEIGTHDNLMKNTKGIYYDMFTKHLIKD